MTQRELNERLSDLIASILEEPWGRQEPQPWNDYIDKFVDVRDVAYGDKAEFDDPSGHFQYSPRRRSVADIFNPDFFVKASGARKRPMPIFSHGGIIEKHPQSDELQAGDTTQLDSFLSSFMNKDEITHESE